MSAASRGHLNEAIEIGARLAGTDAIGAIHVAMPERPGYEDLRHYREVADAQGLSLTLMADSIILRPRPVTAVMPAASNRFVTVSSVVAAHALDTGRRLHHRLAAWDLGFQGLGEGTR